MENYSIVPVGGDHPHSFSFLALVTWNKVAGAINIIHICSDRRQSAESAYYYVDDNNSCNS